jgi:long-chain fatty acid transport protein
MRRTLVFSAALGAFLAGSLATDTAEASGLSTARFGGELGHVVGDNPGAVYYNPGAIGLTKGFNFMADGLFAWRTASYERPERCPAVGSGCGYANSEVGEPSDGVGSNTGTAALSNFAAAPMLGATGNIPINDDLSIGFGAAFFVPFGGSSTWSKNESFEGSRYAGAVDGRQRWWSIDGTLRSLFISAAASVSISKMFHIGVSGGAAISQVNTIRAKALDNSNNVGAEGRAWLNAKDLNGQIGAGVVVTPLDDPMDLRLGFSYQAPVGFNGLTMNGTLSIHDGSGQTTEQNVDFHHAWPDTFRIGVAYKPLDTLELRLNANVQRWSLLQDQCITNAGAPCEIEENGAEPDGQDDTIINLPRRWNDGFGIRLGTSFWATDSIELFGGVGYDSNAIPDQTLEPALTDFHDVAVNAGAKFTIAENYAIAASYTQIFYISRDTTDTGGLHEFEGDSVGPDAGGKYKQNLGFGNLHFIARFDPWADDKPAAEEVEAPAETGRR